MKNSLPSVFTFLSFFLLLLFSVRSDVVQDSCEEIAKNDPNIDLNFCVASLEANPKSKSASSTKSLVPIALGTATSNATSISSIICNLLNNKGLDNFTRQCLEDCAELYSDANSDLRTALQAFNSNDLGTAKTELSATLDVPSNCENGFKEKKGVVSPLTKQNNVFFQLAVIPLAFINTL